jgi:hypothetical protein
MKNESQRNLKPFYGSLNEVFPFFFVKKRKGERKIRKKYAALALRSFWVSQADLRQG